VNARDWERYKSRLSALDSLEYNYDEKIYHAAEDKSGWNIDHYEAQLATEAPGTSVPDGPFSKAKKAIQLYQFPDPNLIRAVFEPERELSGRNMLLIAKFAGLSFYFGVRVAAVIDEVRKNKEGDDVQVWGYAYRTLKGHFEIGEIRFEVSKNMHSGVVSFEISAYSKPDRIHNPFYRVGFRVFSRPLQKYFATSSIRRLQEIATGPTVQEHRVGT